MAAGETKHVRWWRKLANLPVVLGWGAVVGLIGLFMQAALAAPNMVNFVNRLADWRTSLLSDRESGLHPHVAVVLISDKTLDDYPYTVPLDRLLLTRLVQALDAAGAKVIVPDVFFVKPTDPERDEGLLSALRDAKSTVVLAALDERFLLKGAKREYQSRFIERTGRQAGYLNLRVDRDDVIRFRASPLKGSKYSQSLAEAIVAAAGLTAKPVFDRIEWLLPPKGERSPFLMLPAEALFEGTDEHQSAIASGALKGLKDKIVLLGADFGYRDRHRTPLAVFGGEETPGVIIHAHTVAQLIDGRTRTEVEGASVYPLLIVLAASGLLVGWRYRDSRRYLIGGTLATALLVFADAVMFAAFRLILPFGLWLGAWVLGAVAGHYVHQAVLLVRENRRAVQ